VETGIGGKEKGTLLVETMSTHVIATNKSPAKESMICIINDNVHKLY